ncbi:hypothetical protein CSAL01_00546 [Colletotrichum salicis]|uniref:Uncharacterized protein n=1 Tax=Colletotrichum salicis TaxID=1209931 RepID=A0A135UPR2_9PEZI|nr:hypothetical protein CSAL01_00546 [Colletotrichum salicis]
MAAPSSSSSKDDAPTTMPMEIPGAATGRRAAFRRAEAARRASEGPRRWTVSRPGGFSAEEMSAEATRRRRGVGTDPSWIDPAGRLRQLPPGTRLPSPVPLTEEELSRARNSGAGPPIPYPRRSPSPGSRPIFGPITEEEHNRRVFAYHALYRPFMGNTPDIGLPRPL